MINVEQARKIRNLIEQLSASLNDETALEVPQLFPIGKDDKDYNVDDRVRYNDELYRCLQTHSSQLSWNPINAPSLGTKILIPDPETIPEGIQPESTNPYMINDKVTHNDKIWICIIDNNVGEPGVYGGEEVV